MSKKEHFFTYSLPPPPPIIDRSHIRDIPRVSRESEDTVRVSAEAPSHLRDTRYRANEREEALETNRASNDQSSLLLCARVCTHFSPEVAHDFNGRASTSQLNPAPVSVSPRSLGWKIFQGGPGQR